MAPRDTFIGMLLPHALEASKRTGVDPRIIIAQGALESNWGRSAPGNNLFGIKSHGQSGGNTLPTTEVINGQPVKVKDSFRAYGSPGESVAGYADFITSNPRYKDFRSAPSMDAQIAALGRSGYATDPDYAKKIASIAGGIDIGSGYAVPGTMAPQTINKQPAETPIINTGNSNYVAPTRDDIPRSAVDIAGVAGPKRNIADVFSLLALQQGQQQAPAPQPVQGPSPQQASALLQLVRSLNGRMA